MVSSFKTGDLHFLLTIHVNLSKSEWKKLTIIFIVQ